MGSCTATPLPAVRIEHDSQTSSTIFFPKRSVLVLRLDEHGEPTKIRDRSVDADRDMVIVASYVTCMTLPGEQSRRISGNWGPEISLGKMLEHISTGMAMYYDHDKNRRVRSKKVYVRKISLLRVMPDPDDVTRRNATITYIEPVLFETSDE